MADGFSKPKTQITSFKNKNLYMEFENYYYITGLEVIKRFSCSTQLSTKFILLINVKMPNNGWHFSTLINFLSNLVCYSLLFNSSGISNFIWVFKISQKCLFVYFAFFNWYFCSPQWKLLSVSGLA